MTKADLKVLDAEPVGEDVVAKLEEVLERAKAGELSSVAVAVVYRSGHTACCWSKASSVSLLIGAVTRLQSALVRFIEE